MSNMTQKREGGNDTTQRNETASLPLLRHVPQLIWDLIKRFEDIVSAGTAGIQRGSRKEEVYESPGRREEERALMRGT